MNKRCESELYILAFLNEKQEIIGFPVGGGSSQPSYIRAFDNVKSATRSRARMMGSSRNSSIIKVGSFEILNN